MGFWLAIFHFGQASRLRSKKPSTIASPPDTGTIRASVGPDGVGDGVGVGDVDAIGVADAFGSTGGAEGAGDSLQPAPANVRANAAVRMVGLNRRSVGLVIKLV